jgi:flagellar biosynthesis protein FliR
VFTGARVSGLMVFCPFLGSDAVPIPVKAGLTLLLTDSAAPAARASGARAGIVAVGAGGARGSDDRAGAGTGGEFSFRAALMAGQILGVQIGYSLANVFDPQTQADTPVLSEFHRLAALLIFLQLDVHHWLLRSLVRSFAYLPPGEAWRRWDGDADCCTPPEEFFWRECRSPRPRW